MTGQDILSQEFERAGMRGYRSEQVDTFLQQIANEIDAKDKTITEITYKMQILADKIEEYKSDESNIRDALLGAQKLGASILNEARSKSDNILNESKVAAEAILTQAKTKADFLTKDSLEVANKELLNIRRQTDSQKKMLEMMKKEVGAFKTSILKQYRVHLDLLSNLPSSDGVLPSNETEISDNIEEQVKIESREIVIEEQFKEENNESINFNHEEFKKENITTIKSDVVKIESDIESFEKEINIEQTKEFANEMLPNFITKVYDQDTDGFSKKTSKQKRKNSYVERFGDLKFGDIEE